MSQIAAVTMTRKRALEIGWKLFWFATGTSRVKMIINSDNTIEFLGTDLIKEK